LSFDHLPCFHISQDIHPTIEDIYVASVETDKGTKETLRFYDTEGIAAAELRNETSVPRQYHSIADAFILVFSTENRESFEIIDLLRKDIEKHKEKKEVSTAG